MQNDFSNTPTDDSQLPDYLRISQAEPNPASDREAAINLIRQKLNDLYSEEPSAQKEIEKITAARTPLSKHQQYMQSLNSSGMNWSDIQNAWHRYYVGLTDAEKHEVWQEFYAANRTTAPLQQTATNQAQSVTIPMPEPVANEAPSPSVIAADFTPVEANHESPKKKKQSVKELKKHIRSTVSAGGKLKAKDHLKSLMFGLASGTVVVFIFLFGFFNEVFITPFIQPSRQASETPVIVDPASAVVGQDPKIIIPKINVEIPTDYSQTSTSNKVIESALDNGIVHYPTTVRPGQPGNAVYFGHSSNNIFNSGKYKFAFVLLHKLVNGDTFYITYEGKVYAYEVIDKRVVEPTQVEVLQPVPGQTATATLITCDPPGTALKRLVVIGKQISPDPAGNVTPAPGNTPILASTDISTDLPGNGPTLWSRMWNSIF